MASDPHSAAEGDALRPAPPELASRETVLNRSQQGQGSLALDPGRQLGAFVVEDELGRGGMGIVVRARHGQLGHSVALKVLSAGQDASPAQRERFAREATAAARLRHPGIVPIHDVGQEGALTYLVMDLVQGESLAERLEREGPLPPEVAARAVRDAALAIHCAHEHMILHRDIKPGNIMIRTQDEQVLVTDFGLAKLLDTQQEEFTRSGHILGTPAYMAPEQAASQQVDWRSDVYGLGATLYDLLVGEPPFTGEGALEIILQSARGDPVAPSRRRPEVSPDLETICLKALERQPDHRYPTCAALAKDLDRYLGHESIQARPPTARQRLVKWGRRNPLTARVLVGATLLLMLVAVGAAVWIAHERGQGAAREAEARRRAVVEARQAAIAQARQEAQKDWLALEGAKQKTPAQRLGLALQALQSAQRWRAQADADRTAAAAAYRAATRLGELARATQQWDLASQAFAAASDLGFDDAVARAAMVQVERERNAERERRRAAVEAVLDRADRGELARDPDGIKTAVIQIVRYPSAQTVRLLCRRLDSISEALEAASRTWYAAASRPDPNEAAAGLRPMEGVLAALRAWRAKPWAMAKTSRAVLEAAEGRLEKRATRAMDADAALRYPPKALVLLGRAQRLALKARVDVARVACEALGWIHQPSAAPALTRYLIAEADPIRAIAAGVALCRLGSPPALRVVQWGLFRHGLISVFTRQVLPALEKGGKIPALDGASALAYRQRGLIREFLQDFDGALADFDHALRLEPTFGKARLDRAKLLARRDEPREARAEVQRVITAEPTNAYAHAVLGYLASAQDPREARRSYRRALRLDPNLALAWYLLAALEKTQRRPREALRAIDRAIELQPSRVESWIIRAGLHVMARRRDEALRDYTQALAYNPINVEALINRAMLRRANKNYERALRDLERVRRVAPREFGLWLEMGAVRMEQGDFAASERAYRRATAIKPKRTQGWFGLATARRRQAHPREAIAAFDRCLALDPKHRKALDGRAWSRIKARDPRGALKDFQFLISLQPSSSAWTGCALAWRSLRRLDRALACADKAIQLSPRSARAWGARGNVLLVTRKFKLALRCFSRAVELEPKMTTYWISLGLARATQRDFAGAAQAYREALKRNPRSVAGWLNLGAILHRKKRVREAMAHFNRALTFDPRCAPAMFNRAHCKDQLGDRAGAIRDYRRYLGLRTTPPSAKRAREALKRLGG